LAFENNVYTVVTASFIIHKQPVSKLMPLHNWNFVELNIWKPNLNKLLVMELWLVLKLCMIVHFLISH